MACGGGRMGVELEGLRTGKGFIKDQERLGKAFRGWEEMDAGGSAKGVEGTVKVGQGAKSHGGSRSLLEKPVPAASRARKSWVFPCNRQDGWYNGFRTGGDRHERGI